MKDINSLVRPNVRRMKPYSSARDEYAGKEGIFLDANENPFGPLNRYPDPYQAELKAEISKLKGIPVKNIFLGNGSDEVIDLVLRIFCTPGSDRALTFTPTYGMYQVAADANDVEVDHIPLDQYFQLNVDDYIKKASDPKLKVTFICSPNNPSGNKYDRTAIRQIISAAEGIVLLDEAYIDFSDEPSFLSELGNSPNLIVMQTFSKAWGMASARVGMAFASHGILRYFDKMKPPYNISMGNQKTILRRIKNRSQFNGQVRKIRSERERVASELKKIPYILKVWPSDSNFLLVRADNADSLYNYLIENRIIIRDRSRVAENCLRITIGTKKENDRLLKTLKEKEK